MPAYALTLFLSAFLLFLVEPLIGRYILPWHGGSPAVWTTCMLFFQVLLIGGYAYAHGIGSRLKPRTQALVHGALLLLSLASLPITPADSWKPTGELQPVAHIALLLLANVGLPFFVLSTTGPLLQSWLGLTHPGRSPYRLYALSNVGSFLALLAYPFCLEWLLGRREQTLLWSLAYAGFVFLCLYCAWGLWRRNPAAAGEEASAEPASDEEKGEGALGGGVLPVIAWFLLPAIASALLLATTNVLCQDVAVVPFLWVLPLALYLLSFILSFAGGRWYSRPLYGAALGGVTLAALWVLGSGSDAGLGRQVAVYGLALFLGCMVCHGELYRLRPPPRRLTFFYLAIAVGGGLGGVFVALAAPLLFTGYNEWPWSFGLCLFCFALVCLIDRRGLDLAHWRLFGCTLAAAVVLAGALVAFWAFDARSDDAEYGTAMRLLMLVGETLEPYRWTGAALVCLLVVWIPLRGYGRSVAGWHLLCVLLLFGVSSLANCLMLKFALTEGAEVAEQSRNFYGILRLFDLDRDDPVNHVLVLRHGRITHGTQFMAEPLRHTATTYYAERSGVALMLRALGSRGPVNYGVVGLGAGTLAVYGREGDRIRFYEINPEVVRIARERFSYLSQSASKIEIALGDARLNLEREPSHGFDLLALDAFSGDAIPVHLLTEQAFEVYLRQLRPGGVLAVHISNRFMDLEPVVEGLKKRFGLSSVAIKHFTHPKHNWDFGSDWILLSSDPATLAAESVQEQAEITDRTEKELPLWTDDYASILPLLR